MSFLLVHLHLLCDLVGSRGPSREDLWPILYLAPFSHEWVWLWRGQWPLDAWPNRVLTILLLGCCLWVAPSHGDSFVGVFNRRLDRIFVDALRKWRLSLSLLFRRE